MTQSASKKSVRPERATLRPASWLAAVLAAAYLVVLAYPAAAISPYDKWADQLGIDTDVSYDGTRVMEMQGGKFTATERRAPGKMYTEVNVGGMSSAVILREDLQKSYLLMPSMGFYQEKTLDDGMLQSSNGMEFNSIEKVGNEEINGYPSTRYKTRFEDNEGKGVGMIWVTDAGVPIKMDMIYSNSGKKGQRITMQLTELNIREQDPAAFEVPANLKPMSIGGVGNLGQMMTPGAASERTVPATASAAGEMDDRSTRQQACLEAAATRAAEQKKKADDGIGFNRLMGSITRTANRFGLSDVTEITKYVYDADATAEDVAVIADELGISEDEVERCQQL